VRQLERDHPALHNVIDRLQREEKEHWTIVLELQRVELALVKHVQKEAEEEELEATEHHHHHHHQHHHHEKEQSKSNDDDVADYHVLQRERSELIAKRSAVQEAIMEVLDDVPEA
jgi:hypothetical protein